MALLGKAYRASVPLVVLCILFLVAAIIKAPFLIGACVVLAGFIAWIVIKQPTSGEG